MLVQQKELFGDSMFITNSGMDDKPRDGFSLEQFRQEIKDCQKCSLGATRTHFVFGVGNPDADPEAFQDTFEEIAADNQLAESKGVELDADRAIEPEAE